MSPAAPPVAAFGPQPFCLILGWVLALLLLGGCCDGVDQAQDTVLRYNSLLSEGYRNLDMGRLPLVATSEQAAKVYHHMAAMGEGRMRMEAVLEEIEFLGVQKEGPERMEVDSKERWLYRYIHIETGEEALVDKVTYTLRYHLRRVADTWKVDTIDINSSENSASRKALPFLQRPATDLPGTPRAGLR